MIEIKNVSKSFGNKTVVKNVNTTIKKGSITSFIGPNGAGKSTLLSIMARLIDDYEGEVIINDKSLKQWDTKELSKVISILKQSNNISLKLTVKELVSFGRFPYSNGNLNNEDKEIIDRTLKYMKLEEIKDKYLDELSGGQRQRAYIAMVIAQDTEYILLDEPLNNLDMKHSVEIMQILQNLVKDFNKTILIVIHDINFASKYSDYVLAMKDGKVVEDGSKKNIINEKILKSIYDLDFKIKQMDDMRLCVYY